MFRQLRWVLFFAIAAILVGGAAVVVIPRVTAGRDYLKDANDLLAKGDVRSAQIQLRNAVRNQPENAEARFRLASVDMMAGDPVAAEKDARNARELGYDPHKVTPLLAQAYLAQNKLRDLLKDFEVTGSDPALDSQILVARGSAQAGLGKLDDARASYAEAERLAPKSVEPLLADTRLALARRDLKDAKAKIAQAIALEPHAPEVLLRDAQVLRTEGDGKGALAALDEALTKSPGLVEARIERASLLVSEGEDARAKQDLDAILAVLPNDVRAIYMEAVLLARAKDWQNANAALERIDAAIPSIPRAYYLQSLIKLNLGQPALAEEAAGKYVARNPADIQGIKLLASIQLSQREPGQVIQTLAPVSAPGKADAQVYDLLGRAYALTGKPQLAVQSFQQAATLAPQDAGVQERLAATHLGMGDVDAAAAGLEHTLQIAPTRQDVGPALFFAELATGDISRAAASIDQIRKAQGDTPIVQYLDGVLKLAQIDLPGAQADFEKVLQASPDFTLARVNLARIAAMQGRSDDEAKILNEILAKQPASDPALTMAVTEALRGKRMADATGLLERAHAAAPDNVALTVRLADLYSQTGNSKKALDMLAQIPVGATPNPALVAAKARAQIAAGLPNDARDSLRQVLTLSPSAVDARRSIAGLLVADKDYDGATKILQEGLAITPQNYTLLTDLVAVAFQSGGLDAALAKAGELQKSNPGFAPARALTGDAYMLAKRFDDAATAYAAALKAAPSTGMALRLAATEDAGGHADRAAQTLRDWVGQHPDDLAAVQTLSGLDLAAGRLDAAAAGLQRILDKQPRDAAALNNLAWIYQQKGDSRAQGVAQKAYVLMPEAQTADTLGWIMTRDGQAASGIPLLRQANAQLGNDPNIRYHLAVALKETGQRDEAKKLLASLVGTDVNFSDKPKAQKLLSELSGG